MIAMSWRPGTESRELDGDRPDILRGIPVAVWSGMQTTLKLTKDGQAVWFDMTQGAPTVLMSNTMGDSVDLPIEDARERVRRLVADGWRARTQA